MNVAIHPEPVADSTDVRWVMPAGTLPFVGPVATMPEDMAALVKDGTIAAIDVEPIAVRITLGPNHSWRADGARVRSALAGGLGTPSVWAPKGRVDPDDVLRAAVDDVLEGDVGAYIRSHGGAVTVEGVQDGVVTLSLSGTCAHCPASDITLTDRFETAVRDRFPSVRGVQLRAPSVEGLAAGRPLLGLFPRHGNDGAGRRKPVS